ncbi:cytochrome c5 family protein [Spongiibacter sp.]|uniref:c-type cytochrome n=1 Tax=Spongiibacter sp. TaxID=2024860 RepID=UPI00356323EF
MTSKPWQLIALTLLLCSACSRPTNSAAPMPSSSALQSLYLQSCYSCHSRGANGAPRSGDRQQWQARLAKGMDTLLDHTINGYRAMPPRGMCLNCSRDDYRALIEFMADLPQNTPSN